MPVKRYVSVKSMGKARVTRQRITRRVERWKPSCNKPEKVTSATVTDIRESPDNEPEYVSNSRIIHYGNSRYKHFNSCAHCISYSMKGTPLTKIEFMKHLQTVSSVPQSEWPGQGCSSSQRVYDANYDTTTLTYELGNFFELELAGGEVLYDSYLESPYGDNPHWIMEKLDDLAREAAAVMKPKLDDGYSIPVIIGEFFELKKALGSPKWLMDLVQEKIRFSRARRYASNMDIRLPDPSWKSKRRRREMSTSKVVRHYGQYSVKAIAQSWLAHQFGVKPMINDTKEFITKFRSLDEKILDFIEGQNKVKTYHYEKKLPSGFFQVPGWEDPHYAHFDLNGSHSDSLSFAADIADVDYVEGIAQRKISNLEYHATMKFSYHLPNYGAGLQAFLASLDSYGINFSPSDLWEIIPFSFLVDWVLNVGESLKGLDKENLPVTVVIHDFCHSVKYTREDTFVIQDVVPSNWTPLSTTFSWRRECYYRWRGLPPSPDGGFHWKPFLTKFGLWKVSIVSSIVAGKVLK